MESVCSPCGRSVLRLCIAKVVTVFFILGILALAINCAMELLEIDGTFWAGFLKGATLGIALGSMILGLLYVTGVLAKVTAFKKRLIGKQVVSE